MNPTHRLEFVRRKGCRVWQIPVHLGVTTAHRSLGFTAATHGRAPTTVSDYWHARQHAEALNLNLRDAGLTGKVFAVWQPT